MKIKLFLITAITTLMLVFNFQHLLSAQDNASKKEKNLASVAILDFVNNSGNESFNWLHNSLGDAVYVSMKATFEFNKTDGKLAENIFKKRHKQGREPNTSDIAYLAEQTNSDIVIFGEYDFDKVKNKIVIKTKIFHAGRKEITSYQYRIKCGQYPV